MQSCLIIPFFTPHVLGSILYTKPEVHNSVYLESCRATTHLDLLDGLHVCYAIGVVLFNTSCNCEDVGIEDDVIGIEPHLLYQEPVGPFTHLHLVFNSGGLERWEIYIRLMKGRSALMLCMARNSSALFLSSSMRLEKESLAQHQLSENFWNLLKIYRPYAIDVNTSHN